MMIDDQVSESTSASRALNIIVRIAVCVAEGERDDFVSVSRRST